MWSVEYKESVLKYFRFDSIQIIAGKFIKVLKRNGEEFMIPETSIKKAFEYKYLDNSQRAFENLIYYLFCHEFHQKIEYFFISIIRI